MLLLLIKVERASVEEEGENKGNVENVITINVHTF